VVVLYVLGTVGVVLLLGGLLLGDALDSVFDALDAGPGLTAAIGAALTAVGFGGALLVRLAQDRGGSDVLPAAAVPVPE
jgi:hypothetical protein